MIMFDQSFDKFESIDCDLFQQMLKSEHDTQDQVNAKFQKEAYSSWNHFFQENTGKTSMVEGALACFCSNQYTEFGFNAAF